MTLEEKIDNKKKQIKLLQAELKYLQAQFELKKPKPTP